MNENAFVDLPLVISRQILSRSLDLALLHLLGTFHVIVLLTIFLFDHFHLVLSRRVIICAIIYSLYGFLCTRRTTRRLSNGNKIVYCHSLERRWKENNGGEAV